MYKRQPEYNIICAGSLLGIALHQGTSFPVGKVDFLNLYPLSFKEFLMAMGKEKYVDLMNSGDYEMMKMCIRDWEYPRRACGGTAPPPARTPKKTRKARRCIPRWNFPEKSSTICRFPKFPRSFSPFLPICRRDR